MENIETKEIVTSQEALSTLDKFWNTNFTDKLSNNELSIIYAQLAMHLGAPGSKQRLVFESSIRKRLEAGDLFIKIDALTLRFKETKDKKTKEKLKIEIIQSVDELKNAIINAIIVGLPIDGQLSSIVIRGKPVYSIGYKGILQLFSTKLPNKSLAVKIYSKRYITAKKAMPGPLEEMDLRGTEVNDNEVFDILTEGELKADNIGIVQISVTDKITSHVGYANYSFASLLEVCRNSPFYKGEKVRSTDRVAFIVKTGILRFFKYNPIPDLPNDLLYSEEISIENEMKRRPVVDVTPVKEDEEDELPKT